MLTKVNAKKLVEYMPEKVPFDGAIEIFRKLEKMEDKQREYGESIN
jgi:hypothetical protein